MSSRRLAVVAAGAVAALGALVVVAAVLFTSQDRPPHVPDDFAPPERLPAPSRALPDGALLFDSDRSGSFEVYLSDDAGRTPEQLTDDPEWDAWWPRLSPDRTRVLFYRTPRGVHDTDFRKTWLWVMSADGSGAVPLRPPGLDGWAQQGHAEWHPEGDRLVMFGGKVTNPQVFETDALGQQPRPITRRGGTNIDPSYSPDGAQVAFVGCPRSFCRPDDYEVYVIGTDGARAVRLTDDRLRDHDPYFSPDGTRIAWLTKTADTPSPHGSWNIRLAKRDGSGQRRLTDSQDITSKPEWSRDGRTVFFHRYVRATARGFDIFAIDVDDGTERPVTVGQPGVNEFPST